MRPIKTFATLSAIAVISALVPSGAFAFGTVSNKLKQRSEHERITRLALQCANGEQAPACFQPISLDNVAGKGGTWGAVGAADNVLLHRNPLANVASLLTGDEEYWHCDDADYLTPGNNGGKAYRQSRRKGMDALRECLAWGRAMLYDGMSTPGTGFIKWTKLPPATPVWGAMEVAGSLLKADGTVAASDVGSCTFDGSRVFGRAKCNVLEPWGYVLHMAEDFYSHTNWADKADPTKRPSIDNPPGLGRTDLAPFLDLTRSALPADEAIPGDFTGGCFAFPDPPIFSPCNNRVRHGDSDSGLNKDKELIDTATGLVSDPITPRAKIVVDGVSNAQRAVNGAAAEARRQWAVMRGVLIERFGLAKGTKMACVLTMDQAGLCDTRTVVAVVDTSKPAAKPATARAAQAGDTPAVAAARSLVGELTPTDRVSVLTFDSGTGDEDADPFAVPGDAGIDDARRGDGDADPATTDAGQPSPPDATIVTTPDAPGTTSTPDDQLSPEGDHESPGDADAPQPVVPPQAAPKGADARAGSTVAARETGRGVAAANALAGAAALLENDGAASGQRGVVLATNRLGDVDALVRRIDELADAGTSVSLVRFGGGVPDEVLAAVERARGTVLVLPRNSDHTPDAVADAVVDAGLTRLTDVMGADQEAALSDGNAAVTCITDRDVDAHMVAPLDDDATLVVGVPDEPLKVVVTEARTGRSRTVTARPGDPASLHLDEDGDYDVHIKGPSGRRYTAAIS